MDLHPKTILILHRLSHREWTKSARAIGLSFSEFEYLTAVQEQEDRQRKFDTHGQHLSDIVEDLGVTKASASTMISKLEERGLVSRFPCKMDARAHHIVLTADGVALLAKGLAIYERVAASFEMPRQT